MANGVVYVASALDASATHFDGKLYAVDAANGQVLFSDVVSQGKERRGGSKPRRQLTTASYTSPTTVTERSPRFG